MEKIAPSNPGIKHLVAEPGRQAIENGASVWQRRDADVVALERAHEGFGHSVGLRALDGRGDWLEAEVAREAPCVPGDVSRAVVGQPFDGRLQSIDAPETGFDGRDHKVAN